jgi:hypothetical protein
LWREDAFEDGARRGVDQGDAKIRDRITIGRIEWTIAPEEPAEPPILAATGAVRWMKGKVLW